MSASVSIESIPENEFYEVEERKRLLNQDYTEIGQLHLLNSLLSQYGFNKISGVEEKISSLIDACERRINYHMNLGEHAVKVASFSRLALNQISFAVRTSPSGRPKMRVYRVVELAKLFGVNRNTISSWRKGLGDVPSGFPEADQSGDTEALAAVAESYKTRRLCRRDAMSAPTVRLYDD